MHVIPDRQALQASCTPSVVAIGIFDGVHRGHQALLQQVLAVARGESLRALVYTFHPHPAQVLRGATAPRLIEPIGRRINRLAQVGMDAVWVEPFNRAFAATTADAYVRQTLHATLSARHIFVGAGFTFGVRQSGNVVLLQSLGQELGFAVHALTLVRQQDSNVSSTQIRHMVRDGDVLQAKTLLGHPFMLEGKVVRGAQRGSRMGFGTANLAAENELLPATGVYAGKACGVFGERICVVNVGLAPTFGELTEVRIEAHLLDYDGTPLYDSHLEVELWQRLRPEKKFSGIEELKAQIAADVRATRQLTCFT